MVGAKIIRRQWLLALSYFLAAALAISQTRFDGGVALIWGSAAILIAALLRTPLRRWGEPIAICAAASMLATGLFGLGWAMAPGFAVINVVEAALAAWLFRRLADPRDTMRSLGWFFRFVLALGIVAPLTGAVLAGGLTSLAGKDGVTSAVQFFTGHSLGNLTFTPLALLVTGRKARRNTRKALRRRWPNVLAVMTLVLGVCVLVFSQEALPLLFLPALVVILSAFRTGREGAAIAIVLVAVAGGAATLLGQGPVQLVGADAGAKLQFLQFYLAATVLTVLPVSADLQKRGRILRELRISEERFRLLAEHSSDIIMFMKPDGRIRYVSPAMERLAGHKVDAFDGRNGIDFVAAGYSELVRKAHRQVLASRGEVVSFRYPGLLASGETKWFETHSRALLDEDGTTIGVLSISRDISEQKAVEDRLATAALTDSLTGLPNRRAFRSIVESHAGEGAHCIALLDLDHFKRVNDRHGHAAGDAVLCSFAEVARGALRQRDVVARLGGEEFAVFLPDTPLDQAMLICERLRKEVVRRPLNRSGAAVAITVSGGVAELGANGLDAALEQADAALYRAKNGGRDQLALAA